MSKAVLIMDMPSSCSECPCCYIPRCEVLEKSLKTSEIYECKPDWCPLRELMEKAEVSDCDELCDTDDWYDSGYADGYNACIDELLKGEEG